MKALSKMTRSIKPAEVEKKWHLIDAEGLVVGRVGRIRFVRLFTHSLPREVAWRFETLDHGLDDRAGIGGLGQADVCPREPRLDLF